MEVVEFLAGVKNQRKIKPSNFYLALVIKCLSQASTWTHHQNRSQSRAETEICTRARHLIPAKILCSADIPRQTTLTQKFQIVLSGFRTIIAKRTTSSIKKCARKKQRWPSKSPRENRVSYRRSSKTSLSATITICRPDVST